MSLAHKRLKQPQQVRTCLLESTTRIAIHSGVNAVTIQSIADAAGVTKGGLLHHFPDKKALIEATFEYCLSKLNDDISKLINDDNVEYGRFTRAYINTTIQYLNSEKKEHWEALAIFSITEPELRNSWKLWMNKKNKENATTDSSIELQAIRYSADGIWFGSLCNVIHKEHQNQVLNYLLTLSKK